MPKERQVPRWFVERVKDINLKLIDEMNMSWDEVLEFWQDIITECKKQNDNKRNN